MTESEATEILLQLLYDEEIETERTEVFQMAIKALEEVQQLHEVGTVEEFRRLKEQAKTSEDEMVAELMKLRDRQLHGECYRDMEEQSCTLEAACRDCYEEKVREILQIERKE